MTSEAETEGERTRRTASRGVRAFVGATVLLSCAYLAYASLRRAPRAGDRERAEPALAQALQPLALEKWSGEYCKLSMFIPMTACRKDIKSPGCCNALHNIMRAGCICNVLPPVVLKNGGSPLSFVRNFLNCELHDDNADPVDYFAAHTPCADQPGWCADRRHGIDIRLDASPRGRAQMWDRHAGWQYVVPRANPAETAAFFCAALGYDALGGWGWAEQIGSTRVGFSMACRPGSAVSSRDVRECAPEKVPASEGGRAPIWIECNAYPGIPDMCVRPENEVVCASSRDNQRTGVVAPFGDKAHGRAVGGAHMLCGTSGINESRIAWSNGQWDDDRAYVRDHGYSGAAPRIQLWRGPRAGKPTPGVPRLPAGTWDFDPKAAPPRSPPSLPVPSFPPPVPPSPPPPRPRSLGTYLPPPPPPLLMGTAVLLGPPPSHSPPPLGFMEPDSVVPALPRSHSPPPLVASEPVPSLWTRRARR